MNKAVEYLEEHIGVFVLILIAVLVSLCVVAGAISLENETIRAEAYAKYMGRDMTCAEH